MGHIWRRVVLLLVMVIAVLQVIHMTLLSRLEAKRSERRKRGNSNNILNIKDTFIDSEYNMLEIEEDRRKMHQLVKDTSVLDSSGEYHIIHFLQRAKLLGVRNVVHHDISLVSQSSVSQLHNLDLIAQRWHGLISVAVFALPHHIPLAIETILYLRRCSSSIRYNTSFHLVFPLNIPQPAIGATTLLPHLSVDRIKKETKCNKADQLIESMIIGFINYANGGVQYPNNLLRNVARRNTLTEFVFVIDIDLIPSDKLYENFFEFAKENKLFSDSHKEDKVVYVVPAYEMKISQLSQPSNNDAIPRDKNSLLQLIELMEARPFYIELCWKCQKYTDYDAWQREPLNVKFSVLFEVLWRDPWEPFYISRNSVPLYDERFRQYGFNRISQVCELHMSGYKFSVLNKAFVVHKGFKTANSFHKEKDLEQERNRALFRQFKSELKERYPDSSRRCY